MGIKRPGSLVQQRDAERSFLVACEGSVVQICLHLALAAIAVWFPSSTRAEGTRVHAGVATPAIVQDWMFQASGPPTARRARQEIQRAEAMAARLRARFDTLDFSADVEELRNLAETLEPQLDGNASDETVKRLYLAARTVKRRILFKHPAIDFSQILFIDQPYPRFPTDRLWPYDRNAGKICRHENSHRNGMMAIAGGKLQILDGLGLHGKDSQYWTGSPGQLLATGLVV